MRAQVAGQRPPRPSRRPTPPFRGWGRPFCSRAPPPLSHLGRARRRPGPRQGGHSARRGHARAQHWGRVWRGEGGGRRERTTQKSTRLCLCGRAQPKTVASSPASRALPCSSVAPTGEYEVLHQRLQHRNRRQRANCHPPALPTATIPVDRRRLTSSPSLHQPTHRPHFTRQHILHPQCGTPRPRAPAPARARRLRARRHVAPRPCRPPQPAWRHGGALRSCH